MEGTTTGSAGLDKPEGQFVGGNINKQKKCDTCGFMYSGNGCPNCELTKLRNK